MNVALPTAVGALRPTAYYQPSMADGVVSLDPSKPGALRAGSAVVVVGIREFKDFTPELIAGNLALNGQLNAGRDTTLTATTLNAGSSSRIDAQHNVALTLADNSNWQGQLVAGQDLTLKTNNFSSSGLLLANGNLSADIGQWTNSATLQSLGSQWLNMGSLNSSDWPDVIVAGLGLLIYGVWKTAKTTETCGIWYGGLGTVLVGLTVLMLPAYNNTAFYPSKVDLQSSLTIYNA